MNHIKKLFAVLFMLAAYVVPATAQLNTLTATTLTVAAALTDNTITVASATGFVAPGVGVAGSYVYIISPGSIGESDQVESISGTVITVKRGINGSLRTSQTSGALVFVGAPNLFKTFDPTGACVTATTEVTPFINVRTGLQWLCSPITLSWVPGFGNNVREPQPTAAVASAAGVIVPSGQLFHVTGTSAITGFTLPLGYNGGQICIIPDAIFTTTSAGNIALASTAVVSKQLCYSYDAAAAKPFFPSY